MWLHKPKQLPPRDTPQEFVAPWYTILAARLFGERIESLEGNWHALAFAWRGKIYWVKLENIY